MASGLAAVRWGKVPPASLPSATKHGRKTRRGKLGSFKFLALNDRGSNEILLLSWFQIITREVCLRRTKPKTVLRTMEKVVSSSRRLHILSLIPDACQRYTDDSSWMLTFTKFCTLLYKISNIVRFRGIPYPISSCSPFWSIPHHVSTCVPLRKISYPLSKFFRHVAFCLQYQVVSCFRAFRTIDQVISRGRAFCTQ